LILALIICFFARVLWEPVMASVVLRPIAVEQTNSGQQFYGGPGVVIGIAGPAPSGESSEPSGSSEPSASPGASVTSGTSASPGTSGSNDAPTPSVPYWVRADLYSYNQVFVDGKPYHGDMSSLNFGWGVDQNGNTFGFDANGNQIPLDPSQIPVWVSYSIPGSQYWPVVAFESGLLLLGSMLFAAVAFVWVDRRRPY
jgi:hypothetical protein